MNKKFEYHKEYPEAVYKDMVYRWFNDNTSTMSDAELQKFVNLCMRGNLTFQCADEIDIDDPDISMIDHLLMDIASEKNDELINTYTDEIDWDNDYIEKYNKGSNMDKKLEARIARLEKLMSHKAVKNEANDLDVAAESFSVASTLNDAFKAVVNFRNKLVNANKVSGEFDDLMDDVNEMFGDLQLADQLASKIARLSHKRYV